MIDQFLPNLKQYETIIEKFKNISNFRDYLDNNQLNWTKLSQEIGNVDSRLQGYLNTLNDGKGTINNSAASLDGLKQHLKATGDHFAFATLKANLFNTAINALAGFAITAALQFAVKKIDEWIVTTEELNEKVEETASNFESLKTELESLDGELETNEKRIKELEKLPHLTLIEQDELERLKEANKELERQIHLKGQEVNAANVESQNAAVDLLSQEKFTSSFIGYDDSGAFLGYESKNGNTIERIRQEIDDYVRLSKMADDLQNQIDNHTGTSESKALLESQLIAINQQVNSLSSSIKPAIQNINGLKSSFVSGSDEANNWLPQIEDLEDYYFDVFDVTFDSKTVEDKFNEVWDSVNFSRNRKELEEMARAGTLDASDLTGNEKFKILLDKTGESADNLTSHIYASVAAIDALGQTKAQIDFSTAFSNLPTEKLEEYIAIANSDDFNSNNISSFKELNSILQETGVQYDDLNKLIKEWTENQDYSLTTELMDGIQSSFDVLTEVKDELESTGKVGLDSLKIIASQYPELNGAIAQYNQGLISGEELLTQLQTAYENDARAYQHNMLEKLDDDVTFFNQVKSNNETLFTELSDAYGIDLANYKELAKKKAEVDSQLITALGNAWASYYDAIFDENGMVSGFNFDGDESIDQMQIDQETRNSIKNAYNTQKKLQDAIDAAALEVKLPDFSNATNSSTGSGSSSSSSTSKQEEIDWIARRKELLQQLHDVQQEIADDETASYAERSSALDELIAKDKQRIQIAEEAATRYEKAWLEASASLTDAVKEYIENGGNDIALYDTQKLIDDGIVDSHEAGEKYIDNLKKAVEYYDLMKESQKEALDSQKESIQHQKTKLQLLRTEIELQQDLNDAKTDQINSEMELVEAQGRYVNEGYYKDLLRQSKEAQSIAEERLDTLYEQLDAEDESTEAYDQILVEIEQCKNEIIQCKVEQAELNDTIKRLPIERLQMFRDLYSDIIKDMDNYRNIQDKLGLKPTKEELQEYIDLYSEQIDSTLKQQSKLKDLLDDYGYGSTKFNETSKEIQALDDEINNLLASQVELNNEMLQIPVTEMSEEIEKLGSLKQILQNSIDEDNANGLETTLDQYSELHSITLKQLSLYAQQKTELSKLLSVYDKESEYYKEAEQQIAEIDNNISSCVQETYQWNQELLNLPIEKLADINDNLSSYSSILDSVIGEYDSALSGVNVLINRQVDGIQNQIDALQAANEARKVQLNIEQSLFELERARNQRTIAVIRNGEKIYENDKDAERQAQANHQDALYEKQIYDLEQQIDRLETIRDKWEKIAETIKEAKDLQASEDLFGSGWEESVLSDSTELRDIFKSLYESVSAEKESVDKQIESNERISQMMSEFATRYQEGSLTYEQAINGISIMIASMQDGYSAMENLSGMMDLDNIASLGDIASSADSSIKEFAELLSQYITIIEGNRQSVEGFETSWDSMSGAVQETVDSFNAAVGSMDKYLEAFNKNADAISEHTSTFDELSKSIREQVEALKKAAEALEQAQKSSGNKRPSAGGSNRDDDDEYDGVIVTGVRFQDGSGYDYGANGGNFVDMNTGEDLGVKTHGQYISAYTDKSTQDAYWAGREQQINDKANKSGDEGWREAAKAALDEERRQAEENAQKLQTRHEGIFKGAIGDSGSRLEDELISLAKLKPNEEAIVVNEGEFVYRPEQIVDTIKNAQRMMLPPMEPLLDHLRVIPMMSMSNSIKDVIDFVNKGKSNINPNVGTKSILNDISISFGGITMNEVQDVEQFTSRLFNEVEPILTQKIKKVF